jgi:hypothetical protein
MLVGIQRHAPAALPLGKRLIGPQGLSGRVLKIWSPPEFNPRTVGPVASRYTDWVIPAQLVILLLLKILRHNFSSRTRLAPAQYK